MSNEELQAQFKKCEEWRDPDQWDMLGMLYFNRGYVLNAGVCFQRADALRIARDQSLLVGRSVVDVSVETEQQYAR